MDSRYIQSIKSFKKYLSSLSLDELYQLSHDTTKKYMGDSFDSCSIINAKSGNCSEDCKWCSQSLFSRCNIDKYPLIRSEKAMKEALYNSAQGIKRFSLVTSGRRVSKRELDEICKIVRELKRSGGVIPCVSLGLLDQEDMNKLAEAGVERYHCNMESSPSFFKKLCSTHTQREKLETLRAAANAGMSLCSGGIIGMGETLNDRIELAMFLRDLNIKSIPINILNPIKGTPLEGAKPLTDDEILTTIAIFRLINPTAYLRFAGGRALLHKELQKKALYVGINSAIMGDMLTTLGIPADEDIKMIKEAGYRWDSDSNDSIGCESAEGAEGINISFNDIEKHIWHPYTSAVSRQPLYFVERADESTITINQDGRRLKIIDGMSSWWAAAHGYNNKNINKAINNQIKSMSHVMFGGFTHAPAQNLAKLILSKIPKSSSANLSEIFFADSGSVAVEVALKMAVQYQLSRGLKSKYKFATAKSGYHGDTWKAMSVCDPQTGMHSYFGHSLSINYFVSAPVQDYRCSIFKQLEYKTKADLAELISKQEDEERAWLSEVEDLFVASGKNIAAFIIEPVVQGAGGMRFYSPKLLVGLHALCRRYDILLIFDEIATGFGRTGTIFATEATALYTIDHQPVLPDIMTIGKALTGGYMTLSATLCSAEIAHSISLNEPYAFMHGPTFMGNPLACAVASAAIKELDNDFYRVKEIEESIIKFLKPFAKELLNHECCLSGNRVVDIRVKGAIGVIEMEKPVDLALIQPLFVREGIWLRPFGRLIYMMPPFIISDRELKELCIKTIKVIKEIF